MSTLAMRFLFMFLTVTGLKLAWATGLGAKPAPGPNEHFLAEELSKALAPCDRYDFTLPPNLVRSLMFVYDRPISLQQVTRLAKEFNLPHRWTKMYSPRPTNKRNQTSASFLWLASLMHKHGINEINLAALAQLVTQDLNREKAAGVYGECYVLDLMENTLLPTKRTVELTKNTQDRIDRLFHSPSQLPLSKGEQELMARGVLDREEINELRALRKASEIFESNTVLKNDLAGGFWTNLYGEVFGKSQQLCVNEAETYQHFFATLRSQNRLSRFEPFGIVEMRPPILRDLSKGGHVAYGIRNVRSGEIFVIDGWYERGGVAAHILREQDWRELPVVSFKSKIFRDVVEIVPDGDTN